MPDEIEFLCRNVSCLEYPRRFVIHADEALRRERRDEPILCPDCASDSVTKVAALAGERAEVVRFIGDVHGQFPEYIELLHGAWITVQVGDLGLDYAELRKLHAAATPDGRHMAIAGNHDNYDPGGSEYFARQPGMLGSHGGLTIGRHDGFYMRGAWSIDRVYRNTDPAKGPVRWWPAEELSDKECDAAVAAYTKAKPYFMVSHDCPLSVARFVCDPSMARAYDHGTSVVPTRTRRTLQRMLDAHRPAFWVFGHHHKRWTEFIDGTWFHCLDMLRGSTEENLKSAVLDLPLADFRPRSD